MKDLKGWSCILSCILDENGKSRVVGRVVVYQDGYFLIEVYKENTNETALHVIRPLSVMQNWMFFPDDEAAFQALDKLDDIERKRKAASKSWIRRKWEQFSWFVNERLGQLIYNEAWPLIRKENKRG